MTVHVRIILMQIQEQNYHEPGRILITGSVNSPTKSFADVESKSLTQKRTNATCGQ